MREVQQFAGGLQHILGFWHGEYLHMRYGLANRMKPRPQYTYEIVKVLAKQLGLPRSQRKEPEPLYRYYSRPFY